MQHAKQRQDPRTTTGWRRFEQTLALFRRYGDRYGFDPLMLAAQGYRKRHAKAALTAYVPQIS